MEKVTRLRKWALWRRVAAIRAQAEEQRGEQPEHAEHHLDRDQVGDAASSALAIVRDALREAFGGERGEHAQSLDRVRRRHVLARGERNGGDGLLARNAAPVAVRSSPAGAPA